MKWIIGFMGSIGPMGDRFPQKIHQHHILPISPILPITNTPNEETHNYDRPGSPLLSYRSTIATERRNVCIVHSSLRTLQSSRRLW